MLLSVTEHLAALRTMQDDEDQYNYLRANDSLALRTVLSMIYDPNTKFAVDKPTNLKKNGLHDIEGSLYRDARRLRIFLEGGGYDHMDQKKRNLLFTRFLEELDDADAQTLIDAMDKKPLPDLRADTIRAAYPGIF